MILTANDINALTVVTLKDELRQRNSPTKGLKNTLKKRLMDHLDEMNNLQQIVNPGTTNRYRTRSLGGTLSF